MLIIFDVGPFGQILQDFLVIRVDVIRVPAVNVHIDLAIYNAADIT